MYKNTAVVSQCVERIWVAQRGGNRRRASICIVPPPFAVKEDPARQVDGYNRQHRDFNAHAYNMGLNLKQTDTRIYTRSGRRLCL